MTLLGNTSPVFLTSSWSYIKKKNPDGAQRFMNAHVRAMRFLNRNRDESAKLDAGVLRRAPATKPKTEPLKR